MYQRVMTRNHSTFVAHACRSDREGFMEPRTATHVDKERNLKVITAFNLHPISDIL